MDSGSPSTSSHESNLIDPSELAAAAAGLAAHLNRLGIRYLPAANADKVSQFSAMFGESAAASAAAPAASSPPPAATQAARAVDTASRPASPLSSPATSNASSTTVSGGTALPRSRSVASVVQVATGPYPRPSLTASQRDQELQQLAQEVSQCTRCELLAKCRKQTVFGEGSATPRVAFFGEGPGADEDRTGRPFVGKAGQLLTKMIEACTFRREDVYILNTVKCRPPNNRNPEPGEVQNCREYFETQLNILQPDYIVCLGAVSSQALLQSTLPVGRLRGTFHEYYASKVIVTYHPAYLLRNPDAKRAAWEDLKMMLRDMGIDPVR